MKNKLFMIGLAVMLAVFCTGLALDRAEAFAGQRAEALSEGPQVVEAKQVSGDISLDPSALEWASAPVTVISLLPQDVAEPKEFAPGVRQVEVKALSNRREIAIRLEWYDASKNSAALRHDDYRDGAAVMFPVATTEEEPPDEPGIFPFMGNDGDAVNIWHWKADWQREAGAEIPLRDSTYPHMQADYYINERPGATAVSVASSDTGESCSDCVGNPCAAKKLGYSADARQTLMSGSGDHEGVYDAGQYSKNIISLESLRVSSVEDLNAEGFGTLTTQASQDVNGFGVWGNSVWKVVLKRNLSTNDGNDTQFLRFGTYVPIALAVWEGSNGERDGMKGRSTWHYVKIK